MLRLLIYLLRMTTTRTTTTREILLHGTRDYVLLLRSPILIKLLQQRTDLLSYAKT